MKQAISEKPVRTRSDTNRPSRRRLKIGAVVERLGVHKMTVGRWVKVKGFPAPHYIGAERLWFEDEIEEWEARHMSAERPVVCALPPGGAKS